MNSNFCSKVRTPKRSLCVPILSTGPTKISTQPQCVSRVVISHRLSADGATACLLPNSVRWSPRHSRRLEWKCIRPALARRRSISSSGGQLSCFITGRRPAVPVIVASGYTGQSGCPRRTERDGDCLETIRRTSAACACIPIVSSWRRRLNVVISPQSVRRAHSACGHQLRVGVHALLGACGITPVRSHPSPLWVIWRHERRQASRHMTKPGKSNTGCQCSGAEQTPALSS